MKPIVRFAPSPTGRLHIGNLRPALLNWVFVYKSLTALAALFDFGKLSRAPARFDFEELTALNARLLQELDYSDVAGRLEAEGIGGGAAFWEAVPPNLQVFGGARAWWHVVAGPVEPQIEDQALLKTARELLPPEPSGLESWAGWTDTVNAATGAKGRALFHPLRRALTGHADGPKLKRLLPLIGGARAEARLSGKTA